MQRTGTFISDPRNENKFIEDYVIERTSSTPEAKRILVVSSSGEKKFGPVKDTVPSLIGADWKSSNTTRLQKSAENSHTQKFQIDCYSSIKEDNLNRGDSPEGYKKDTKIRLPSKKRHTKCYKTSSIKYQPNLPGKANVKQQNNTIDVETQTEEIITICCNSCKLNSQVSLSNLSNELVKTPLINFQQDLRANVPNGNILEECMNPSEDDSHTSSTKQKFSELQLKAALENTIKEDISKLENTLTFIMPPKTNPATKYKKTTETTKPNVKNIKKDFKIFTILREVLSLILFLLLLYWCILIISRMNPVLRFISFTSNYVVSPISMYIVRKRELTKAEIVFNYVFESFENIKSIYWRKE